MKKREEKVRGEWLQLTIDFLLFGFVAQANGHSVTLSLSLILERERERVYPVAELRWGRGEP